MGRPKKDTLNTSNNTKNTGEAKELKKENKELKEELKLIKEMLANLNQNQTTKVQDDTVKSNELDDEPDVEIKPNKYIKVMSLNFGRLVLSTEGRGQGKIFTFDKFGDVKNIVYSDLANIIHHQQSFAEKGRFYIFDKNVVKNHGLIEYYDKFLTKQVIENILDYNREELTNLFKNTTDAQRETIVGILIKKIRNGEDIDLNKVDVISRIYGQDVYNIANEFNLNE